MRREAHPGIHRFGHGKDQSRIIDLLRASGKLTVEDLLARVPDLSWSQLFLAIHVLSRSGDLILHRQGFTYTLEAATASPVLVGESHGTTDSDHR